MKEVFIMIERSLFKIVSYFLGFAMIALTSIIIIQVFARYVLHVSIGGFEELPLYLMIISVWLAAPFVARQDEHVKIELMDLVIKNKRVLKGIQFVIRLITTASLSYFCMICYKYVSTSLTMGEVTPGLGIPMWMLQSVILISTFLMSFYYILLTIRSLKEVIKWNS